jgi:hypothetical protein
MRTLAVLLTLATTGFCQEGLWPAPLEFPQMVKYQRARFTQSIATTNGRPSIDSVPIRNLEKHWHQPGGLQDVPRSLWRSDVYVHVEPDSYRWLERLPVKNSFGFIQYELGWTRAYADGTFFCDVLSTERGVFEVRFREKVAGKWENTIAFKDPAARPPGFFTIKTRQCNSCHGQAGTGGYAVGLVPGGDTVLSDPFPALER